jgi:hypothetical protein
MPTINFALGSSTVNWDGGNNVGTDQHAAWAASMTKGRAVAQRRCRQ